MAKMMRNEKSTREGKNIHAELIVATDDEIAVVEATAVSEEDRKLAELGYVQVFF
jgi:archaeosine-15-forming tRNA-guanine transglycosylase